MSILNDPRVSVRSAPGFNTGDTGYLIAGVPDHVQPTHGGYEVSEVKLGWNYDLPPGWAVFNGAGVWIGLADSRLVAEHEIDAKDVYPTAEAAVAAVLAGLEASR